MTRKSYTTNKNKNTLLSLKSIITNSSQVIDNNGTIINNNLFSVFYANTRKIKIILSFYYNNENSIMTSILLGLSSKKNTINEFISSYSELSNNNSSVNFYRRLSPNQNNNSEYTHAEWIIDDLIIGKKYQIQPYIRTNIDTMQILLTSGDSSGNFFPNITLKIESIYE